ncbi:hypothetical protein OSTOST_01733 [Ostertagia ostertagi]
MGFLEGLRGCPLLIDRISGREVEVTLVSNVGASAFEKLSAIEPVLKKYGIGITRKILFDEAATVQDMMNGGQLDDIRSNSRSSYVLFSYTKRPNGSVS